MNIQGLTPTVLSPMQASSASAVKAAGAASASSAGNSSTSPSDLQNTFLNLLVTELQNQDPTSPVDPTQMVSQMVSLNQLEQLVSINQRLQNMSLGTTATAAYVNAKPPASILSGNGMQSAVAGDQKPVAVSSLPPGYMAAAANSRLMNLYASPVSLPATAYTIQTGAK